MRTRRRVAALEAELESVRDRLRRLETPPLQQIVDRVRKAMAEAETDSRLEDGRWRLGKKR